MKLYMILLVLMRWCSGQWLATDCPERCICHQMYVEPLRAKLNAVDCKDRDIVTLDSVPMDSEALMLKGNQLHIESLSRHNLSNILYIDLSHNQLKLHQVEALQAFFTQLQRLRALDLSDNYLETLQTSLFKELKSLEFLSLSGNSIVYIERNTFQVLTNLKILKLDKNHLRRIDENWFNNVGVTLRDLDLSTNRIESLQGGELMQLTLLERLRVSKNNISYVHPDTFVKLNIRELYLNGNQLYAIPSEALLPLKNLTILNMDDNAILSFEEDSLINMPSLKLVSLSHMPFLHVVYRSAFRNLPSLLKMDLFENPQLKYIHPESLLNCTRLEVLHLHGNSLQGLDEAMLDNLPALQELSLYNNEIRCSCLAKWLRNTTVYLVDGDRIVCAGPHAVRLATLYQLSDESLEQECAPIVILQTDPSISADFGTDVDLRCQALGSSSLTWSKSTHSNGSHKANGGQLNLPTVQHSDEGVYVCLATSESGSSDSASVEIRVIHSVIMLSTLAVSKSFIVLKWDDTQGSTVLSYGTGDGNSHEVIIPPNINQYTLDSLRPDTDYVVCLLYHHKLEHSCITVHMLPSVREDTAGEEDNSPQGSSNVAAHTVTVRNVGIAFVIIIVFIILVVVSTIMYKRCQRLRQSKVLYLRHKNDCFTANEISAHITLEQCYNTTTMPLCDNELT